jgi:alpha-D-ribose 1-methylphosphonate 5-triphosphate diphosphatase
MRLVDDDILSLPQAIATVSHNPAKATGLNDRGQIAVGLRADLIQVRVVNLPHGNRHAVVRAVWREGQRVL